MVFPTKFAFDSITTRGGAGCVIVSHKVGTCQAVGIIAVSQRVDTFTVELVLLSPSTALTFAMELVSLSSVSQGIECTRVEECTYRVPREYSDYENPAMPLRRSNSTRKTTTTNETLLLLHYNINR